jgi:hypothetical protein
MVVEDRCRHMMYLFIYFYKEFLLYNKDITLIYVPLVIIYARLDSSTHLICVRVCP